MFRSCGGLLRFIADVLARISLLARLGVELFGSGGGVFTGLACLSLVLAIGGHVFSFSC